MAEETQADRKPEVLVNVSLRFPNLDASALGEHLAPLIVEATKLGGKTLNVSIQPYDPDEDDL
jgi:hypothetical protein